MIDKGAVEEIELRLWPSQRLNVSLKLHEGVQYIDVRKWNVWQGVYSPGKGVMLEFKAWNKAIEAINSLVNAHSSTQKPLD